MVTRQIPTILIGSQSDICGEDTGTFSTISAGVFDLAGFFEPIWHFQPSFAMLLDMLRAMRRTGTYRPKKPAGFAGVTIFSAVLERTAKFCVECRVLRSS